MMIRTTKIRMATPANREARNRLADMDWLTSPQNLLNWADKGAIQLNRLIPALKTGTETLSMEAETGTFW